MLKKEEIKMLLKKAQEILHQKYGDEIQAPILERFEFEKKNLRKNDYLWFEQILEFKKEAKAQNEPVLVRGTIGASFIAYLLGVTEINPLPPHYYCSKCRSILIEPIEDKLCCFDLPKVDCLCDTPLIKDGHNIPFETFLDAPYFNILVSNDYFEKIDKEKYHFRIFPHQRMDKYKEIMGNTHLSFDEILNESESVLPWLIKAKNEGVLGEMQEALKPSSYSDLIKIYSLAHSTGGWLGAGGELLKNGIVSLDNLPTNRDELFLKIKGKRNDEETRKFARLISNNARHGYYKKHKVSDGAKDELKELGLERWLIDYLESIQYLYNKYDVVEEIKYLIISTWYEKCEK